MTEEEAKEKWCCQVNADAKCIASACMAWRWVRDGFGNVSKTGGDKQGFCGLAGRP